ncbi:MAG: toll/interleukin-1 receptor domain-containing protein, partial [bacterium]|nr:toll/interleukin-1 receptor domain-containing protein [bacterium]
MSKIFICYSHKDDKWKERLVNHLKVVEMEGYCTIWDDSNITAGDDWFTGIETALKQAQIAILMISADSLISDFIRQQEVPRLMERRQKEGIRVIPLIIRPCAWKKVPWLAAIQARPTDGKPLSSKRKDKAEAELAHLAEEICSLITTREPRTPPTPREPPCVSQRHIFLSKLPNTGPGLFGRERVLEILDDAWNQKHTHVVTLTAWGGVGKSALVNHWLNRMEKDDFRGAEKIYAWSFYSQGAAEGKQASADEFMQKTLEWFGDDDPGKGAPADKGRRLADLVRKSRTLLVLDGMEPLQ